MRYVPGFEKPSAIQQKGIVPFAKGLDVIQQAQSGTGKTATFCAGILQNLDFSVQECQALVLAPTRELAQQIEKVMRALGDFLQVESPISTWTFTSNSNLVLHSFVQTSPTLDHMLKFLFFYDPAKVGMITA